MCVFVYMHMPGHTCVGQKTTWEYVFPYCHAGSSVRIQVRLGSKRLCVLSPSLAQLSDFLETRFPVIQSTFDDLEYLIFLPPTCQILAVCYQLLLTLFFMLESDNILFHKVKHPRSQVEESGFVDREK